MAGGRQGGRGGLGECVCAPDSPPTLTSERETGRRLERVAPGVALCRLAGEETGQSDEGELWFSLRRGPDRKTEPLPHEGFCAGEGKGGLSQGACRRPRFQSTRKWGALFSAHVEASSILQSAFQPRCESLPTTELKLVRCSLTPRAENFLSIKVKKFLHV